MDDGTDDTVEGEERAVYAIVAIAVAPVVIAAAIVGGVVDSGSTLCLMLAIFGVVGFLVRLRTRRTFPTARIHRR